MADNVNITAGTGTVIATDEVNTGGGAAHVQLMKLLSGADNSTERIGGDAANGLDVDVTRVIPGTGATSLGKAEDAGHSSGDVGVMALSVRQDTAAALGGTDADYQPLITDASGRLHVNVGNTVTVASHAVTQGTAANLNCTEASAATIATNTGNAATSLSVLDDWDETDRAKVNIIAGQAGITAGAGSVAANTPRVTHASDDPAVTALQIMDDWDNGASDGASVSGDVAHDTTDAGEPVKLGHKAIDLGANPTDVAANDRTNWYAMRNGVPFVIGGAPFVKSQNLQVTDADGAQADTAIVTVSAGTVIMVTALEVTADNANTGDVSVRIGFGTANTPAADADKVILFHPGIAPGSGIVKGSGAGIIGAGLSNEDLRVTCEDPVNGSVSITVTYFTLAIG